ncbi:glycoside hydrolase family 3 N-terminal domain-containing protein [Cohnella rhizosphaerae]|uniref:Glycoside hydrolase family 3 C-terminal domain-containing protein n=1 Tax=Cohnella rhizosphaerae TaxID=1457232 RepID=A0A9X4QXH3_9BACL|nr:glycoside hydrolase family 3 N-terminal domain-containing protein [Cohnella rhizosphaerae]MDG0813492.1 glycoside hydrolase family 3 C-terminal domain-containing protein [Cohnella rhizosphaerae]
MDIYKDPSYSIEERTEDLLARMTLKEKVGQLNQHMYGWDAYRREGSSVQLTEAFKRQVAFGDGMGALYGLFRADPWSAVTYNNGIPTADSARVANELQRYVKEHTRLGIPVLLSEECPHGHQALDGTLLPVNLNIGSAWNPQLTERAYARIAAEIRARGAHLALVSTLDILQDPRWGRSEECYGEDPYLASQLTAAVVRGLQGARPEELSAPDKAAAVLKHLCAQGAGQGGHNAGPAAIGERELREIHLPAAKAGADAGAVGFMAAYNEIDGIPCHANEKLLTGILREEWGFDGIVMADGCAIDRLLALSEDHEEAAATALSAGVDLSLWDTAFTKLEAAVRQSKADEALIDRAVRRVLRLKFRLGLFENPYVDEGLPAAVVGAEETRELNLQLARESIVLLRNGEAGQQGVLPLDGSARRIAVIGPNADALYNQLGDYTSVQRGGTGTTVLQGIAKAAPAGTEIVYERGCGIRDGSREGIAAAVAAARGADIAVVAIGGSSARSFDEAFDSNGEAIVSAGQPSEMDCGEGVDLADLRMGGVQEELVRAIAATGTPVVAVVIQGRPHELSGLADHCAAILCAWYPGPEGGRAIGEIVFGKVNPSGKLPVSLPRSSAQLPVYYNQKNPGRSRPYVDMPAAALYPFGYGLSYTTFEYGPISLSRESVAAEEIEAGGNVEVRLTVSNSGDLAGAETVQLYIQAGGSPITRRTWELKGFRKVWLEPGAEETVVFRLGKEELAIWDRSMTFAVAPCRLTVRAGGGSAGGAEANLLIRRRND